MPFLKQTAKRCMLFSVISTKAPRKSSYHCTVKKKAGDLANITAFHISKLDLLTIVQFSPSQFSYILYKQMAEGKIVVAKVQYQVFEITEQHINTMIDTDCFKNNNTK